MAWSIVASAVGTNTATMPAHQVGDYLVVGCARDGSNTPPSLVANWISINAPAGANSFSHRIAWRRATSTSMVTGTWTNATSTIVLVIRNGSSGVTPNGVANSGNNGTFNFAALSMNITDGSGGLLGFVFSTDGTATAAVATAPANMTNQDSFSNATNRSGLHYDLSSTGWPSTNVTAGVSAVWRTFVLEIIDESPSANTVGKTAMGASAVQLNNAYGCLFTPAVTGTINRIRMPIRHDSGGGDDIRVAVYTDVAGVPTNLVQSSSSAFALPDGGVHMASFTSFSGTINVTAGTPIWLCVWPSFNAIISMFYDAGASNQLKQENTGTPTYPTWPSPFGATNNTNNAMSIWADITPAAGGPAVKQLGLLGVG